VVEDWGENGQRWWEETDVDLDGTPNEAGHITEVVDLIVLYKDHHNQSTFHVTGIG